MGGGSLDLGEGAYKVDGGAVFALHADRVKAVIPVGQLHDATGCIPHLQNNMGTLCCVSGSVSTM